MKEIINQRNEQMEAMFLGHKHALIEEGMAFQETLFGEPEPETRAEMREGYTTRAEDALQQVFLGITAGKDSDVLAKPADVQRAELINKLKREIINQYERDGQNLEAGKNITEQFPPGNKIEVTFGEWDHNISQGANQAELEAKIAAALNTLTPREQKVIRLRLGLDEENEGHTLKEIGEEFGIGNERVRQIEAKALRKLRHPSRSRELKDFLLDEKEATLGSSSTITQSISERPEQNTPERSEEDLNKISSGIRGWYASLTRAEKIFTFLCYLGQKFLDLSREEYNSLKFIETLPQASIAKALSITETELVDLQEEASAKVKECLNIHGKNLDNKFI